MTQRDDAGLIADMQAISARLAEMAAWLALGMSVYLITRTLVGIAAPVPANVATAAFYTALAATALAGAPFIRFIVIMWGTRYEEIRNRLNDSALGAYLLQFWERRFVEHAPGLHKKLELYRGCPQLFSDHFRQKACDLFETVYNEQYGRAAFVAPVILALVIVAIEAVLVVFAIKGIAPLKVDAFAPQLLGAAAGTYMFVVGDCVMSARRRSLNISDVYWYALRLFLAVPIGFAIYNVGGDMMGAFVLGTLPIDQFRKVLSRYAGANFTDLEKQAQAPDQLVQLEGVTADIAAQLALEGITSIEQIVGSDPVSLAIRTGLPFKLMLRLGSQAVVRRHLKSNAAALAGIGLGDAEPIARLLRDLHIFYKDATDQPANGPESLIAWLSETGVCKDPVIGNAVALINEAAAGLTPPVKTPMTPEALLTAFQCIADESYTKFLMANDDAKPCAVRGCVPPDDRACQRGQAGAQSQAIPSANIHPKPPADPPTPAKDPPRPAALPAKVPETV